MAQEKQSNATKMSIQVPIGGQSLQGELGMPSDPHGIVLFAHGSGSSRHSPPNQYVARARAPGSRHVADRSADAAGRGDR